MCCTTLPRVLPVVVRGLKFWAVQNFSPCPTPFRFSPASCHVYKSTVARIKLDTQRKQYSLLHGRLIFDGFWPWLSRKALCDQAFTNSQLRTPYSRIQERYTFHLKEAHVIKTVFMYSHVSLIILMRNFMTKLIIGFFPQLSNFPSYFRENDYRKLCF